MSPPSLDATPPSVRFPCKLLQLVVEDIEEKAAQRQFGDEARAVLHELGIWFQSVTSLAAVDSECAAGTPKPSVSGAGDCDEGTQQNIPRLAPGTFLNPVHPRTDPMVQTGPSTKLELRDAEQAERGDAFATVASAPAEGGGQGIGVIAPATHPIGTSATLAGRLLHNKVSEHEQAVIEALTDIDEDGSGRIETDELERALYGVGMSRSRARLIASTIIEQIGEEDGGIDRATWSKALTGDLTHTWHLRSMVRALSASAEQTSRFSMLCSAFMLSRSSPVRLVWDLFIALSLLYIAIFLPCDIAFGLGEAMEVFKGIDLAVDAAFIADVILNFRTGFFNARGKEVLEWWPVAQNYLRSWFLIDAVSSIPTEVIADAAGTADLHFEAFKILKASKVVKAFRLLKVSRIIQLYQGAEFMNWLEDHIQSPGMETCKKLAALVVSLSMLCHWLACIMALVGTSFFDTYAYVGESRWSRYWCSLYWAMTTITTVGYGDLTPKTDIERAAAILCMAIGGAFYGYLIGNLVSIVSSRHEYQRRYHQMLDQSYAWVERHKFPRTLTYRIRRYLRTVLIDKGDPNDTYIDELSPALQRMAMPYLVPQEVRNHGLFKNLPESALNSLNGISHRIAVLKGELIAEFGEIGTAMFIVLQGNASIMAPPQGPCRFEGALESGDSFGEEFLIGKCSAYDTYRYTVTATSHMTLQCIRVSEFAATFSLMPEVMELIRSGIESLHGHESPEGARPLLRKRSMVTTRLASSPPEDVARTMGSMNEVLLSICSAVKLLDQRVVALHGAVGIGTQRVAL